MRDTRSLLCKTTKSTAKSEESNNSKPTKYLPSFLRPALLSKVTGVKSACDYQLLAQSEVFDRSNFGICDDWDEEEGEFEDMRVTLSNKHLVSSTKNASRKKWLLWGGLATVIAVVVIVLVVVLVVNKEDEDSTPTDKRPLRLEDILDGNVSSKSFNGSFISPNEVLFRDVSGDVVLFDVEKMEKRVLVSNDHELADGIGFWLAPDKNHVLVAREYSKIFRHSFTASYSILNLVDNSVTPVKVGDNGTRLMLAHWNPVTSGLVFVFQNDIYYKTTPASDPVRVTFDQDAYVIMNGIPDWVYEEEIFSSNSAIWFSPDGTKFAFGRFDDTPVRQMNIPVYGIPGSLNFQYTNALGLHYPKAGTPNPTVQLYSVNINELDKVNQLPYQGSEPKPILAAVNWMDNNRVLAIWLNRVQNESQIHICQDASCEVKKEVVSETGWLEFFHTPTPNKDGSKVAMIISQPEGDDSYPHLTMIDTNDGSSDDLTRGKFTVVDILKWDHESNVIFYTANTESHSEYLHVYAVLGATGSTSQCLTCGRVRDGVEQTYFSAEISPGDRNTLVLSAEGPSVPETNIYDLKIDASGAVTLTEILDWESNEELRETLNDMEMPTILKDSFSVGAGMTAQVIMVLPPGLDQSGSEKYPMLVDVYGGPNSNNYLDKFGVSWGTYLASNKSIIYAKIDGRGSGLRGDNLLHQMYRKFGTVEIEDQITTARSIAEKYQFVDKTRMAIWGWSYGGYASAMALAKDIEGTFKCAASVAPVTDWVYYDSIYTERYMGLPSPVDNEVGYTEARLSTMATHFKNKTFLLVHGTLDDNVHYQQAMALARSLEKNDVSFKQISYPDEDHSLAGVRPHLYHSLGRFFNECFDLGREFF